MLQSIHGQLLKIDFDELNETVRSLSDVISCFESRKASSEKMIAHLENEASGAWAEEAKLGQKKLINKHGNVLEKLTEVKQLTEEYKNSIAERTGCSAGVLIIDGDSYKTRLDAIESAYNALNNFDNWQAYSTNTIGLPWSDPATLMAEEAKADKNEQAVRNIFENIKPGYMNRIKSELDTMKSVYENSILPLIEYDREFASRISAIYAANIPNSTRSSIESGHVCEGIGEMGSSFVDEIGDTIGSFVAWITDPNFANNLVDGTAGVLNYLLSWPVVEIGKFLPIDENFFKTALGDVEDGNVERYKVYIGTVDGVEQWYFKNEHEGWAYSVIGAGCAEILMIANPSKGFDKLSKASKAGVKISKFDTPEIKAFVEKTPYAERTVALKDISELEGICGLNFQDGRLTHILVGDKKGGFHTKSVCVDGFVFDESSVLPLQGGAYKIKVSNPEIGMSNKVKSLFPNDWSVDKILEAIRDTVDLGEYVDGDPFIKEYVYEDVKIRAVIRNDEIITAYPIS